MHAQGPWWKTDSGVRNSGGYVALTDTLKPFHYEGQDERYAKECEEREDNAALIASAPELLQALKDLQKQMRASHGKWNVKKDYSLMVADVAASKAIDKAEGRS